MAELKKPTTYDEQLDILRSRGITIQDTAQCKNILESVNYYRLTAYFLPFKRPDGLYVEGTSFLRVYHLYEFDRKLRGILFSAVEDIEVFLRSKLAYFHAHRYGAEGYLEPANFSSRHDAEKFLQLFQAEVKSNKNALFVKHHEETYGGRYPIWVATELFTFGMLSFFFSDMTPGDQKDLSRSVYQSIPKNVRSWLRCCTDLRNICAHYGRLYYRIFSANPAGFNISQAQKSRLWGAVLSLRALHPDAHRWNSEVVTAIQALFEEYDSDISLYHIAFPDDWVSQLLK